MWKLQRLRSAEVAIVVNFCPRNRWTWKKTTGTTIDERLRLISLRSVRCHESGSKARKAVQSRDVWLQHLSSKQSTVIIKSTSSSFVVPR